MSNKQNTEIITDEEVKKRAEKVISEANIKERVENGERLGDIVTELTAKIMIETLMKNLERLVSEQGKNDMNRRLLEKLIEVKNKGDKHENAN